jgi:hypothetical protein
LLSNNLADGLSAVEEPRLSACCASQNQKYSNGCGMATENRQANVTKVTKIPKMGWVRRRLQASSNETTGLEWPSPDYDLA